MTNLTKTQAYFDNAATTFPKPQEVYDTMLGFYKNCGGNAGRGNSVQAVNSAKLIDDTRKKLLTLFHAPLKQVIFTPSATIALNMIIQGLIKKGITNVYISPFEHNAVTRTLHAFEKESLIKVHKLEVSTDFSYQLEKIKYDFDNIKPDLVIVTHASNVFGFISPIEELFELAKKYDAVTVTDMAQTAGLVDTNIGKDIFDFAVFAGHKTLYGPTGISGFLMKKNFVLPSVLYGGTGYESANQDMPGSLPEKYEMGTQNILGISGLYASLEWIEKTGIVNLRQKEDENRLRLLSILSKYSFVRLLGNNTTKNYVGIVSAVIEGIPSDSAASLFAERNVSVRTGLQCAPLAHKFLGTYPTGTIRFSTSYFTSEDDFDTLNKALEDINENL